MINYSQPNFFEHLFKVVRLDLNTRDFIYDRFSGKSLLHVGCVDSMHYSYTFLQLLYIVGNYLPHLYIDFRYLYKQVGLLLRLYTNCLD